MIKLQNLPLWLVALLTPCLQPTVSAAHTSEQSFVLLLPTELYISAGIAAVALTVLILAIAPSHLSERVFSTFRLPSLNLPHALQTATSLAALVLLAALVAVGYDGQDDPLSNPLPLMVWTVWWMALLFIQGVVGDLWSWINPWTGLHRVLVRGRAPILAPLPNWAGHSIAVLSLLGFHMLALADPAPDNPARLAGFVAAYWAFTFAGMLVFGRDAWLGNCECFTVLFGLIAKLSPFRPSRETSELGLPGWQLVRFRDVPIGIGLFSLIALGTGSFDGLNETFWWLALIGVNPLEFPGRSAVVGETIAGILAAPVLLVAVFGFSVWLGTRLARSVDGPPLEAGFSESFRRLAISVLPIALGYHFAHFLTAFMVNIQYTVAAISDPLHDGSDYLGLGTFYVTTGFFNTLGSVRVIWLSQCLAVVLGHVVAVVTAHEIARRIYGSGRRAVLSQLPISAFMILYTLLSLWLLASPRGA